MGDPAAKGIGSNGSADAGQIDQTMMRQYRLRRVRDQLAAMDYAGALLFDPINIRYATGTSNMQVWDAPQCCPICVCAGSRPRDSVRNSRLPSSRGKYRDGRRSSVGISLVLLWGWAGACWSKRRSQFLKSRCLAIVYLPRISAKTIANAFKGRPARSERDQSRLRHRINPADKPRAGFMKVPLA